MNEMYADYVLSLENVVGEMEAVVSAFYSDAPEVDLHDVPVMMASALRRNGFWVPQKAPFSIDDFLTELTNESRDGDNEAE